MPESLSYAEATAGPFGAVTAITFLQEFGAMSPGERMLLIEAGGWVGVFGVQIGNALGAHVTAACGPGKQGALCALGADRVLNYTREDYQKRPSPMT